VTRGMWLGAELLWWCPGRGLATELQAGLSGRDLTARAQTCTKGGGFAEASGWPYAHTLTSLKVRLNGHGLSIYKEQALRTWLKPRDASSRHAERVRRRRASRR